MMTTIAKAREHSVSWFLFSLNFSTYPEKAIFERYVTAILQHGKSVLSALKRDSFECHVPGSCFLGNAISAENQCTSRSNYASICQLPIATTFDAHV